MITLSKSGNTITFTFDENSGYLQNGTIDVPVNSLSLVMDESDMATFKKSASNDIFISARYEEFGMSKSDLETWYKNNMVGSTGGGGGGGVTPQEVEEMIDEAVSGKADTSAVTEAISSATEDYFDGAEYDSGTTRINFYHGNTVKAYIDASAFIVDGMIDNVSIETISGVSYLVIDFNTASGKEDIQIPLTDIFDPSNYYNKTEIDAALSGKADTTAVTETISAATDDMATQTWVGEQGYITGVDLSNYATLDYVSEETSGKVDTSTYNTYTAATNTALNGKQGILYAQDGISLVPHPYRGSYIKTKYRGWGDFQQYDFRPSGPFYVVVGFDCVGSTNGSAIFEFEVDNETKAVRIDFDSSTESWTCDSWEDPQICEDLWQYLEISWDSYKGAFEVQPQVEVTANDDSCVRFTYDLIGVGTTTDALDAVFDNLENKADKYYAVASAEYVSSSTTINFKNVDGDVISSIDASAFVIDGMIDDVRIDTISGETYLVIDFNTASGKEDIEIPISDIFDADNYYTKNEVDSAISAATSGKQDTLIAGENITISGNVISASGGGATYIAGDGINIDSANTISATFEGFVGAYEETSFENIDTDFYLKIANDCNPYSSEDIEGTAHTKVNIDGQDCIYIVIIHSLSHTYSVEPYNELSPIDGWQDFFSIEWEDDVEMYKITVLQEIAEFSDAGCTRVVQESEVWIDASGTTTNALKWFKTYSDNEINGIYGSIDDLYNRKQDKLSAGTGINISNNVISASGSGAVELTQAQYDALVSAGTVSTDTLYIITDATPIDLSPYWTSAQTQSAITEEISAATSGKVDTSSVVTAVTSASTDSEIPTAKAVYDAVGSGGGGGTTYSAGTNIDITNDTISCTLPIEESGGGIILRNSGNSNAGANLNSKNTIIGYECKTLKDISSYQTLFGTKLQTYNNSEFACGFANVSHSGSTLFSVGNGSNEYVRHNAFEIRQNGDIYISSGGTDILLQDNLGGGSITIDQSLDSGSTNPVANSAITSALTVDTVFLENYDGETIPTIVKLDKITKIYVSFNGSYTSTWNFVATMGNNNTWTANQSLTPYNSDENNYAKSYKLTNQGYSDTAVLEAKEGYWFWDVSFSSTNPANVKTFKSVEGGYVNSVLPSVIGIVDEMEVALDNKINSHTANTSVHHTSTSAVTSGSTDVVTSGGVYDQLGGLKLQQITQAAYDALVSGGTVDSSTLYIITNVVN